KSVLLIVRTLKLESHFDPAKTPPQFEEMASLGEKDSKSASSSSTNTDGKATPVVKKSTSESIKILQEYEKYVEWAQHDSALMTWLDGSMSITYQNMVVHCKTFAESWETLTHIFTMSSRTKIHTQNSTSLYQKHRYHP
ncbi:hypothetical protein PIB30_096141, partial [Stylosanthes scabra]|nr:hypothetical protein [Stylosanthes scabra]